MAASAWTLFVLLVSIQLVFSRDCSDVESILNCNECIRCGGQWCNKPKADTARCTLEPQNDWCIDDREALRVADEVTLQGSNISPIYIERTALVGAPSTVPIVYKASTELKTSLVRVNTTQNFEVSLNRRTKCNGDECTVIVETSPLQDFCSSNGRLQESFTVQLSVADVEEKVHLMYRVPCACECSERVDKDSSVCNFKGDYSCGVCACKKGWTGEFCDKPEIKKCENSRGDILCDNPNLNWLTCSGNGICEPCGTCECFADRPGSRYFDESNYCTDLCMDTATCDQCLRNPNEPCICDHLLEFTSLNKDVLLQRDSLDRNVWVKCNLTLIDGCYVEYAAMKENHEITVMMLSFCEAVASPSVIGAVRITIPIILGIVAALAGTAAVATYAWYKRRAPPLPLADPQYQNIGAEDCIGENPLYKPPNSLFNNPTYGKW